MDEPQSSSDRSWRILRSEIMPDTTFYHTYLGGHAVRTPVQYFEQYFSREFLEELCYKAVRYRITKDPNSTFTISPQDLRTYLGITIYMTLIKVGSLRRYWASSTRVDVIAKAMTRDRFESITASLHFEDESLGNADSSRTKKFQPIIDRFNEVFLDVLPFVKHLSIDEQIIAYKGKKSGFRKYNLRKPNKWGWKIFVLSGRSGMIHRIEFYRQAVETLSYGSNVNKPGQVVLRLASVIPVNCNHKLYFDNWFNSPAVQVDLALRGIWSIGTLMVNRAHGLKFETTRRPERGSYVVKTITLQGVTLYATQWFDNKPVTLLIPFCAANPETEVQRFDRRTRSYVAVPAPDCITVYNKHMGYVDEINSYLGRYGISTHVRNRAYLKIFFNFVNIVATNCWIQYRRDSEAQPKSEVLDLYRFKANLADSLCRQNKVARVPRSGAPPKRPRPGRKSGLPPSDIRLDQLGHWPIGVGSEHRGQNCKLPGCKAKPVTKCEKCNVTSCISAKNCFKIFHTLDRI